MLPADTHPGARPALDEADARVRIATLQAELAETYRSVVELTSEAERAHAHERQAERLEDMVALAVTLGHEMGSPLQVITGQAELMLYGDALGEGLRVRARRIVEAAAAIENVVARLRTLTDLERQSYSGNCQMLQLAADDPAGPEREPGRHDRKGAK